MLLIDKNLGIKEGLNLFYNTAQKYGLRFDGTISYNPRYNNSSFDNYLIFRLDGNLVKPGISGSEDEYLGCFRIGEFYWGSQSFRTSIKKEIDYSKPRKEGELPLMWYNVHLNELGIFVSEISGRSPGKDDDLVKIIFGNSNYMISKEEIILNKCLQPNPSVLSNIPVLPQSFTIKATIKDSLDKPVEFELKDYHDYSSKELSAKIETPYLPDELICISLKLRKIIETINNGAIQGKYLPKPREVDT